MSTVPKFTSFRPKPGFDPVPKEPSKDVSERKHNHHHHHQQHRSPSTSRERGRDIVPIKWHASLTREPSPPPPEHLFVVDLKGDVKNLLYGGNHKYNVPPYHRFGSGRVLGLPFNMVIDRDLSDDKGVVIRDRRDISSMASREKYIFSKVAKEKPRLLKIRPEPLDEASHANPDFVPFQTSKKRKRGQSGNASGSENDEEDYRSIHGKAKAGDQPIDNALVYATESESSGSDAGRMIKLDAAVRQKSVVLSRKVDQSPHDIDAWLALIEHQDTILGVGDDRKRITNAEMRSTADIKIHMYEKALAKASSLPDRERLLLGLMNEGSKIWEIKTLSDKWERISKENIDSLLLWKSYLNFEQTTFSRFRYEETRDVFVNRIRLLSTTIESASAVDTVHALYEQLLYVLLRFTTYIRESGYSELAVAIWQGLLEFTFFAPEVLQQEKVAKFNEFWDSEVPRIGEEGTLGWAAYAQNETSCEPPDPKMDGEVDPLDDRDLFKSWARAERLRSKTSQYPARTMDEVAEDDPFRVILASDIEGFLVPLPPNSEKLKKTLLDAFLLFCGLPPLTFGSSEWSCDPFIERESRLLDTSWLQHNPSKSIDPHESQMVDISSIFDTTASNFVVSAESMFDDAWFKSFRPWKDGDGSYSWTRTTLRQLAQTFLCPVLAQYHLAFEWRNEPGGIKKVAKTLLKRYPSSLMLYNAYGMIEWSRGNEDAANSVFSAALSLTKSTPESKESIFLWKSWVWAALEDQDNSTVLRRLLSIVDDNPEGNPSPGPVILLRTKQHLSSNRDYCLSSCDTDHAIIYAELLALLEYITSRSFTEIQASRQGDITSALEVYSNLSRALIERKYEASSSHELLLQSATRLLYHHAKAGPFRPGLFRQHLTNYITLFPRNTIFLSLYIFNESRLRIDNRVRTILLKTILTPRHDSITSRLSAIIYEVSYGTAHSVRSAFENAVSASGYNINLWKFYILYCSHTPPFNHDVGDIWYRALKACPWAKELYLVGFENIERQLSFADLKATWKVMGEKDLRVHIDLEDKFEDIGDMEELPGGKTVRQLGFK